MAKSFFAQLNDVLDDFHQIVKDEYEGAAEDVANECVAKLKAVTWKHPVLKNYSRNWTVQKDRKGRHCGAYTVHNKKTYRLTHLLENTHMIVNAKGEYGRTSEGHGQKVHIYPVYEWAQGELMREIQQRIERKAGGIYG